MHKFLLNLLVSLGCWDYVAAADITAGIEIEALYNSDNTSSNSNISLSTIDLELGIDHSFSDKLDSHMLFLYEKDDGFIFDKASIDYHFNMTSSLSVGRMQVPFGNIDSMMLSDPQTLELSETREDAFLFSKNIGNTTFSAYLFQDNEDGSKNIDDGGLSLSYKNKNLMAGIDFISDVNDKSDEDNQASGTIIYTSSSIGKLQLNAEHIRLNTTANGEKPKASNLEIGFNFSGDKTLATSYQITSDANATGLAKKLTSIAYDMPINENTHFAVEYMHDKDYAGEDNRTTTLQIIYEFL